jgi:ABC-2 type transport system ATP-binding protein
MDYILNTNNLSKSYRNFKAVDNVNINIKQGDIYGLIGRNGAGKTTLMKMISSLASPTEGSFQIFGEQPKKNPTLLSRVGVLIEAPGLYPNMTAYENLKIKCLALGAGKNGKIEELLSLVGLSEVSNKKTKAFSLGMKQRLGIAMAMVTDPDLLILDEPINGLDPQGIAEIRDTLLKINQEKNVTIIISSHILEELSKIATRYGIINKGKLIEEITAEELNEKCQSYILLKTNNNEKACTILDKINIKNYKVVDNTAINVYESFTCSGEIATALTVGGVTVNEISEKNTPLEEYFLNLTGGADNA